MPAHRAEPPHPERKAETDGCWSEGSIWRLFRRATMGNHPLCMCWELTHRCPLDCRHCYLRGAEAGPEMSLDQASHALEALARAGVLFLVYTGGEPTLHPNFWDIAFRGKELGFCAQIYTGATHFADADFDRMAALGPFSVEITLHGPDAGAHDAVTRRPGSFAKSVRAIRELVARGVKSVVKVSVFRTNVECMDAVRNLAHDLGASFRLGNEILAAIGSRQVDAPDLVPSQDMMTAHYRDLMRLGYRPRVEIPTDDTFLCGAGRGTLAMDPTGLILPCVIWREPLGNVLEKPFGEIWNGEAARRVREFRYKDLLTCRTCDVRQVCKVCPGEGWLRWRDPVRPAETTCRCAQAKHAALLEWQAAEDPQAASKAPDPLPGSTR